MSKLLDRLERITRGTTRAIGFIPVPDSEPVSSMVLLVFIDSKSKVASVKKAMPDAFILTQGALPLDESLEKDLKPIKGITWGVEIEKTEYDHVEAYRNKGSDFLVFGIEDTRVDALEEGDLARILRISTDLEEPLLRGLEDLPVDIILLRKPPPEGPLSLAHILAISNVRLATSRYLLLEWDGELAPRDLEHLRGMGIDGIVVDVSKVEPALIATLREKIGALPPRKPKTEQRSTAVLPRIDETISMRPPRREEEDDDEDEDGELEEP